MSWIHKLLLGTVAAALLTTGLVPGASAVTSFAAFGSKVAVADNDFAVNYEALGGTFVDGTKPVVCRLVNSGGSGILTDYYYLHWAATCAAQSVATGDIRLTTGPTSLAAGTVVASGNADFGQGFAGILGTTFLAGVQYLEADGLPGYSAGDLIYFSADATVDAVNGDIRLSGGTNTPSAGTLTNTAGTIVGAGGSSPEVTEAGDADGNFPESATLTALPGGATLRFFDSAGNGVYDQSTDRLYVTPTTGVTAYPRLGDLLVSSANSQTYGARVVKSNSDFTTQLTLLADANAQLVVTTEVTGPEASRYLFIHFPDNDGANDHIQVGDLIVKAPSGSFGGRVTSVTEGQLQVIGATASLRDNLFFLDIDSNDKYTPETDPVYINRPAALGGSANAKLDALDIRVTGWGSFGVGTIVTAPDGDVTAYGALDANDGLTGKWLPMLHDVDLSSPVSLTSATQGKTSGADSTWTLLTDGAYLAAASAVAGGDVRLKVMPHLANVVMDCNGTAPDHPSCSATLAATSGNLRTSVTGGAFSATGGVYHSTDATVNAGDIRIYHPTLAPGTVAAEADVGTTLFVAASANNPIRATTVPPVIGTDSVFHDVDADGVLENGDVLIYKAWGAAPAAASTVSCIIGTYHEDCGAPVLADANIRVTGGDATYTAGRSEYVYYSKDTLLNAGDYRFLDPDAGGALTANSNVIANDADTTRTSLGSSDELYLAWCTGACATHANNLPFPGDLLLASGTATRVSAATAGHAPTLTAMAVTLAGQSLKRYDLNAGNGLTDDTFYLSSFATADKVASNDVRLTAFSSKAAGTQIVSSDTQELASTMIQHNADSAADGADYFAQLVKYVELDGTSAYSAGDGVYADNFDADLIGATATGPSTGDIRLSSVSLGSFAAGTIVFPANTDATSTWGGSNPTWKLYFFDENRDAAVSLGEAIYVVPGDTEGSASVGTAALNSVRLVGTTSTGSSGGGGGGGSTVTTTTTTTTTTTSSTSTTAAVDIAAANQNLRSSTQVIRDGSSNTISWSQQTGVAGYQVWGSESPFVLVATLNSASTTSYVDASGAANRAYLVTAFLPGGELTADQINAGTAPGYSESPTGTAAPTSSASSSSSSGKSPGFIPGPGLVTLLGAIAVALVLVRRKL